MTPHPAFDTLAENARLAALHSGATYGVAPNLPARTALAAPQGRSQPIRPVDTAERSANPLRPSSFAEIIGQEDAVAKMRRFVASANRKDQPLDHTLLVGASGTGKSTFSHVIAAELGVDVYEVEAPVSHETLLDLREVMRDRDILRIEEVHQQGIMERRGRGAATQPEVLYAVMEDRTLTSGVGVLPFPAITIIGTTTDEGLLPDAFINRFPIRPRLARYGAHEIALMAIWNAERLELRITAEAAVTLADAARGVPREINNFIRNAAALSDDDMVGIAVAQEVLDLNGVTGDGLTTDMQGMLTFLLRRCRRDLQNGEVRYEASLRTIATAIGKSRDSKAIVLRVEPYLIEQGLIQVGHGGRQLTDAGAQRARELLTEGTQ